MCIPGPKRGSDSQTRSLAECWAGSQGKGGFRINRETCHRTQRSIDLSHVVQDRAYDTSDDSSFDRLPRGFAWEIFLDGVSELRDRECLQPDSAWSGQGREKKAVSAEDHVPDAGNSGDLERHTRLKCADVSGMDPQIFAGLQITDDQLSG